MHNFDLRMHFWERGAYYFLKNYQNVIIVPAAVALLLEQHNSREQQLSISLTTIKLWCHPQSPAVILTTHTLTILGIHIAHLAYIKLYSSRTVRFSSPAFGRYIGPPMATSNTLRNIQTDAANDTDTVTREGVCSAKWCKPLPRHWKDFSRSRCVRYYTRELTFSPSTAMKSRPAYYTRRLCIILKILLQQVVLKHSACVCIIVDSVDGQHVCPGESKAVLASVPRAHHWISCHKKWWYVLQVFATN